MDPWKFKSITRRLIQTSIWTSNQYKLGVIRTLYDRCDNIVTDPKDAKLEVQDVNQAKKVPQQLDKWNSTPKKAKSKKDTDRKKEESPIMISIGVLETQ